MGSSPPRVRHPLSSYPLSFESYEQAGGWLRATFGAWADELSDEEHDAIRYYASPVYETMNLALRERRAVNRDQERHAAALDRALRVTLPEPVIAGSTSACTSSRSWTHPAASFIAIKRSRPTT